ncbi:MAG: hypothetical protein GXO55_05070 [Chloroflexi bacterium]|nr:hypothetical protein [Chloroflexota bacterium]
MRAYIRIVTKRLWLIALLVLIAVIGVYLTENARPPKYQARVRLQVLSVEPEAVSLFTPLRQAAGKQEIERTAVEFLSVLRNRKVAWDAAREINQELGTNLTGDDIIKRMWPWIEGEFISVTYTSVDSATVAKRMADVHIAKALEYYRSIRTRGVTDVRLFLEEQVNRQKTRLAEAQEELRDFRLRYNLTDVQREATAVQDQLRALQLQRDTAQLQAAEARAQAKVYREQARALQKEAASQTDAEQKAALLSQAQAYTDRAITQDALAAARDAAFRQYDRMIASYQNRLAELIGLQNEYEQRVHAVQKAQDEYNFLADKLNEARIKEELALDHGYIQIVEAAREPVEPLPKKISKMTLYAAGVAFLLGVVLAFVLEFLEQISGRRVVSPRTEGP